MARVAASLAAACALVGGFGCGSDTGGAEPGASDEATLVLDFTANAAHAGVYAALERGLYARRGVELEVREPTGSADAPKLLAAGRTDFAVLDVYDLGIARRRGIEVVGLAPVVGVPLAAVIARPPVARPRELEGGVVGVTGVPSDEAVLDAVVSGDGGDPALVKRVTIGFDAVGALAAGRVDAATAFWNAEGVALRQRGVPTREFRLEDFVAGSYPELVLVTAARTLRERPRLVAAVVGATARGTRLAATRPRAALRALLAAVPALDRHGAAAQLRALVRAGAFEAARRRGDFRRGVRVWARFAARAGLPAPRGAKALAEAFPALPR